MILITGATGNIGREVVNLLLDSGEKVVAVTRHPATAALPDGAHVVGADPSRPQTLMPAQRGVDVVFISPRALGDATAGAATAELLKLAAEQGAQRPGAGGRRTRRTHLRAHRPAVALPTRQGPPYR